MKRKTKSRPVQFSLRSLLAGLTWLALILAVCVHDQQTAARQRQAIHSLKAAGWFPAAQARVGPRPAGTRGARSERPR